MNTNHQNGNGNGNGDGQNAYMHSALLASELSYRRLFEAAQDGILILDVNSGCVCDVNPFLVNLLGFSWREMVGKTVSELSPFKDTAANKVMLEQLQRDEYIRYDNLPLETRDGRHIAVEFVSNIYNVGDKKVIQCNIRDITEHKKMEAALRASEERYRSLYNSIDEGFCVIQMIYDDNGDPADYRFLEVNPAFEKHSGIHDALGKRMSELVPGHDRFWFETYGRVSMTGEPIRFQKKAETMNRWFDVYAFRLGDAATLNVAVLFTDISERKEEEEKSNHLNIWLEERISERTSQLKSAVEEMEAFSYSVSHDLRAPLRHIIGFVKLLEKNAGPTLSKQSLRYLATIFVSAKRMGALIDDLLDFSRIGRVEMSQVEFKPVELIQELLDDFQMVTKERKIEWQIQSLPAVRADRALIRMVLVNLVGNALKFTSRRKEARIEIGCAPGKDSETVIFIRDNGAGFDQKYAGKLFGVFQRLHSNAEFEGTGIGLANVQRIVHRHGGRVWAEGEVGVGATFYFSLPKPINGANHER